MIRALPLFLVLLLIYCQSASPKELQSRKDLAGHYRVFSSLADLSFAADIELANDGQVLYYSVNPIPELGIINYWSLKEDSMILSGSMDYVGRISKADESGLISIRKDYIRYLGSSGHCSVKSSLVTELDFTVREQYDTKYVTLYLTKDINAALADCYGNEAKETESKIRALRKKYGKKYAPVIVEKKFMIGMTKEMVIESIGEPQKINRTVTGHGVSEQWVYGYTYLYFEGNTLRSFQD